MSVKERPPPIIFTQEPLPSPEPDPDWYVVPLALLLLLLAGVAIGLLEPPARSETAAARSAPAAAQVRLTLPLVAQLRVAGRVPVVTGAPPAAPTPFPPAAITLAAGWRARRDLHDVGLADGWGAGAAPARGWRDVTIPNDFNPDVTRAGDRGQVWWYETTFTGPRAADGRGWDVAFESVRRHATVFLNGVEIGSSDNPYAPFSVPATTLVPGARNMLTVRVENFHGPRALPADSFPEDWWNWGGIMGPVTLQPAGRVTIDDLGVMPVLGCDRRCGWLKVRGTILNTSSGRLGAGVDIRVVSPSGAVLTGAGAFGALPAGGSAPIAFRVPIPAPQLWSPARPALYAVDVRTVARGRVEQEQRLKVGMRRIRVRGGILYLNGQRLWLHGAAIHEDLPGQGAALTNADIATIVGQLKAVGANVTRAHYQLSPRLLDAFDRAGIMVWSQPPVDHADVELADPVGRAEALAMLRATLIADRNHPSVIVDSVGNELSPTPETTPGTLAYLRAAIPLARALNPGVPVGLDTYCYPGFPPQRIYRRLGVLGISDYFGWYSGLAGHSIASFGGLQPFLELTHLRYPGQALVIAEWGAEAFYSGSPTTKGTYEFQSAYVRDTLSVIGQLPYLNGQIYWTLRDFAVAPGWTGGAVVPPGYRPDSIHHKGLLSYVGAEAKPAFYVAQRLFAEPPWFVPPSAAAQARVAGSGAPPPSSLGGPLSPP